MRKPDITRLKARTVKALDLAEQRFLRLTGLLPSAEWPILRWGAAMTAVEVHATWERYVERRLIGALAIHPGHLIAENGIAGLKHMPVGLAEVIVRGGGRFFDFRSSEDLIGRATRLVGRTNNPFLAVPPREREHLDVLAAVRNYIAHRSDAAGVAYRRSLRSTYGIKAAPDADEFLNAVDWRKTSPHKSQKRLIGLIAVVRSAVAAS